MITSGTEWTTAVTDLINGLITLIPVLWCLRKTPYTKRYQLWTIAFAMLAVISIAGFFIHGFEMSESLIDVLWCGMYIILSLMISAYVTAVKYDIDGEKGYSHFHRISIILAVIVSLIMCITICILSIDIFLIFSIYCLGNMIYCIISLLGQVHKRPGFKWYLISIFVLIIGSILQTIKAIRFTIIWQFNSDTVYHFMTLLFMLIQFKGVRLVGEEKEREKE